MTTLYVLKGLPASGKTTLALQMVKEKGVKRVNKDELRAMIDAGVYSQEAERFITDIRDAIIAGAANSGWDVVVDDTNMNPKHIEHFKEIAAGLFDNFEIIELKTDVEECVRRDAQRQKSIGEQAIRDMSDKYGVKE